MNGPDELDDQPVDSEQLERCASIAWHGDRCKNNRRAGSTKPDHLLLDEPTNNLDIRYQHEILRLVRTLEVTTVVVLHDLNLAARYCDTLVMLDRGRVVRTGAPEEVRTVDAVRAVYGMHVDRVRGSSRLQLIFSPVDDPDSCH